MKVRFDNVDLTSSSGPNNFATKLMRYFFQKNISVSAENPDVQLSFIEIFNKFSKTVLRLDGIYFNTDQDWQQQNKNIKKSYDNASHVIVQSEFNRKLINKYFGEKEHTSIIQNGTCLDLVDKIPKANLINIDKIGKLWVSASSWRPHKRLPENIRLFNEMSSENDIMLVAGKNPTNLKEISSNPRVKYIGNLNWENLISLFKVADNFIHLAWLDHCPNVVVDAKASGCTLYCSSAGGTVELASNNDVVVVEDEWDFKPCKLYDPPPMDFTNLSSGNYTGDYSIEYPGDLYIDILKKV